MVLRASRKRGTYLQKYADMHYMQELKDYDGSVGTSSST